MMDGNEFLRVSENAITIERREQMVRLEDAWENLTGERVKAKWEHGIPIIDFGDWYVYLSSPTKLRLYRKCEVCSGFNNSWGYHDPLNIHEVADIKRAYDRALCNKKRKCRKKYKTYKTSTSIW